MIDLFDLVVPGLPSSLEGLRIAHLTDLHIRRRRSRYEQIPAWLAEIEYDLAVFTGDYMTRPGDEGVAIRVLEAMAQRIRPRLGSVGVFGNHDTNPFRVEAMRSVPIRWLVNQSFGVDGGPLEVVGLDTPGMRSPDVMQLLRSQEQGQPDEQGSPRGSWKLLLCHKPDYIFTAADLGMGLMLSGHTHGGQWRLPGRIALKNCSDLPLKWSAGVLQHGRTLCAISRGAGEVRFDVRFFCRAHVPVYTLRSGLMNGEHARVGPVAHVVRW